MIKKRKEKINFLLENKHYRKLHLYLYLISISIITAIYFILVIIFSAYVNIFITGTISILIGVYLVFNREKLVRLIDSKLQDKKREKYKEKNKEGLKTTLRTITPKNKKLKLNIGGKTTIKEKFNFIKEKLSKKKGKEKEYLEVE